MSYGDLLYIFHYGCFEYEQLYICIDGIKNMKMTIAHLILKQNTKLHNYIRRSVLFCEALFKRKPLLTKEKKKKVITLATNQ